jgi:surface antigen
MALAAFSTTVLIAMGTPAAGQSDADYLADVMNQRLESQRTGVEVPWMNPSTGNGGMIVIFSTDDSDPERPCRSYRRTIESPGEPTIVIEGNACRVAVSIWQRSEAPSPMAIGPGPAPDPAPAGPPLARADAEPAEPPPQFPPPPHKPDPDIFHASIPTPSVY